MKPDNCSDKKKFKTSQAATKAALRTKGIINTYFDILDYDKFIQANTNWSKDAKERFGIEEPLFYKEYNSMKAVFNTQAFHKIDAAKGVFYPENEYLRNRYQTSDIQNPDINEALEWINKIFPNANIELTEELINGVANGSYNTITDLITLSTRYANKQTAKHEVGHYAWNKLPNYKKEELLNEGSKLFNIPRGESKTNIRYSTKQQNEINYVLKAVDVLQSEKGIQIFNKGNKNNWSLDKILQELQIPKEQKQLILNRGFRVLNNNDARLDNEPSLREQIITDLLANYSFTVEINTAREEHDEDRTDYWFENKDYFYNLDQESGKYYKWSKETNSVYTPLESQFEISKEQYFKELKDTQSKATQYYSNLTVPGGTNYTENEISTPLITPSIKGHAQFSTDNGIGWFRSDEQVGEKEEIWEDIDDWAGKRRDFKELKLHGSKTRRILEVQSDLFQKGRDKENLISESNQKISLKNINDAIANPEKYWTDDMGGGYWLADYESVEQGFDVTGSTKEQFLERLKSKKQELEKSTISKENQFLQLLNKDNNWVTFFVKSIIQDSVKKGYEKVLFPTGNTASKVEGHTTLEEFKKQKEDRIKELENNPSWISNGEYVIENSYFKYEGEIFDQGSKLIVKDGFYNIVDYDKSKILSKEQALNFLKEADITPTFVSDKKEINQLKQELERVEREGFGALKPIYNFYENTVANILNKIYGKIQDYSNTPVKKGVDSLFEENKELSKIGNKQLYSAYLDSIFPDSKVKDIVYRGGNITKEEFADSEHTPTDYMDLGIGLYLSPNIDFAKNYGKPRATIVNIKNPKDTTIAHQERVEYGQKEGNYGIPRLDSEGKYDGIVDLSQEFNKTYELVVFEPEQIHILGSKQDIEGFKKFVKESSKPKVPQITDEFGNTWNQIDVTPEMAKEAIKFQSPKLEYSGDLAIEEKIMELMENTKDEFIPKNKIEKWIQSVKNFFRNLFKEKTKIQQFLRDINQGRFTLVNKETQFEDIEFINEESKTEDIEEDDIVIEEQEIEEEFDEIEDILYKMSQKYGEKITIDDWNLLSLEQQEYLRECYG